MKYKYLDKDVKYDVFLLAAGECTYPSYLLYCPNPRSHPFLVITQTKQGDCFSEGQYINLVDSRRNTKFNKTLKSYIAAYEDKLSKIQELQEKINNSTSEIKKLEKELKEY